MPFYRHNTFGYFGELNENEPYVNFDGESLYDEFPMFGYECNSDDGGTCLTCAYKEQIYGLIDGGVDLLLIETCQDVLQIKSALLASKEILERKNIDIPLMVSITMETTGTMLVGSDIASALTILEPFNIDILGLNCATGPEQMKEHIKYLSENSPFAISCIPNAGLPENIGGVAHYRLSLIHI